MKLCIRLILLLLTPVLLNADPNEDMTFEEAQMVVDHLKKYPYVLDYCDCCDGSPIYLVKIVAMEIEPAEYGTRPYRVKAFGSFLHRFDLEVPDYPTRLRDPEQEEMYQDLIWTNYTWVFDPTDGKAKPLGQALGIRDDGFCRAPTPFPDPALLPIADVDKDYHAWYRETIGYSPTSMQINLSHNESLVEVSENDLPEKLRFHGSFVAATTWNSGRYQRILVVSEVPSNGYDSNELHITEWFTNGTFTHMQWEYRKAAGPGEWITFEDRSLQVADLFANGNDAPSFIYTKYASENQPAEHGVVTIWKDESIELSYYPEDNRGYTSRPADADGWGISYQNYNRMVLQRFLEEGEMAWTMHTDYVNGDYVLVREQFHLASEGQAFRILNKAYSEVIKDPDLEGLVEFANSITPTPDEKGLLIFSLPFIEYFNLETGKMTTLMQVFEGCEGISSPAWSADGKQLAFVVLNFEKYPKRTRLFVLNIEGAEVTGKKKKNLEVQFFPASEFVVYPVVFTIDGSIKYQVYDPEYDGPKFDILKL